MTKPKSPPPHTWIPAPLGWWFKGPFNRRLAHVWQGNDGFFHAYVLRGDESIPRGPFSSEDEAMKALAEELTPQRQPAKEESHA